MSLLSLIINNQLIMYRYQLERYRGRSTRHVCPQCGRKNVFTRYIDTENNNIYISDNVGKCNRLDKCGYHYTPHQYFTDNPWKREKDVALLQTIGKSNKATTTPPPPHKRRTLTIATSLSSLLSLTSLKNNRHSTCIAHYFISNARFHLTKDLILWDSFVSL